MGPTSWQEPAAGAVTTVQLFTTALGAAAAGTIANLAGISEPGGIAGAANAAIWIFSLFAIAPIICLPATSRISSAYSHT